METCERTRKRRCMSKIWICSWQNSFSKILRSVLPLRQRCEDHGYSCDWTGCQKPHLSQMAEKSTHCSELRAYSCPRPFKRMFEFWKSRQLRLHHRTQKREESTQRPIKRRSKQNRTLARGDLERTLAPEEDDNLARGDSMHDLPEWLQEVPGHFCGQGNFNP